MSLPLADHAIVSTQDVEHAQSILCRELADVRIESVASREDFRFEMNGVRLGKSLIGFNHFSTQTLVDGGVIEDALILSLSVGAPAVPELDGEPVATDRFAIVAPRRQIRIHRAAGSGVLMLRADINRLQERFVEITGQRWKEPIQFESSLDATQGMGVGIRRFMTFLVQEATNGGAILTSPMIQASIDDLILSMLLSLPSNYSRLLGSECRVAVSSTIVQRAEEFMEANAKQPITMTEVVSTCQCSRKALYTAFRKHRGYTPLQFLTERRLWGARRALLSPDDQATVETIAREWGFSHLGRFAESYRRRFGEKPSATRYRH